MLCFCRRPWPRIPLRPQQRRSIFRSTTLANATSSAGVNSKLIPSFRENVARSAPTKHFIDTIQRPKVGRQILFAFAGTFVVVVFAAATTSAHTERTILAMSEMNEAFPQLQKRLPTNEEMQRVQYLAMGTAMQKRLAEIKDRVEEWPIALKNLVYWSYVQVAQPWLDANEGRRTCWKICMVNTAIWMAWQVPRLQPLMQRHFTHNPLSGLSYTILTSMFSHRSLLHLIANCMALSSFGSAAGIYLARQQHTKGCERESTIRYHLEAFILSAGLFSGLISHVASSKILYPMMVRRLTSSTAAGNVANATRDTTEQVSRKNAILPSLGISGAVYGAVTLTALAFPDTEISLMIPPTYPIPIQYGVGALVMLDIIGVLRGWRFLDHYAHLGGAAFGVLYYHYGPRTWNTLRCAAEDEGKAHKPWRVDPGRT